MVKTLTEQYTETLFNKLSKVYYKSLFFNEHFDIHYLFKNFQMNDLLLEFLTKKLYASIEEKKLSILFLKYTPDIILQDIRDSIREIFLGFNAGKFVINDVFNEIFSLYDTFDCEYQNFDIDFNSDKFQKQFYIEKYIRVEDLNNENIISNRIYRYKGVLKRSDFNDFIQGTTEFLSIKEEDRRFYFKSIKQGIRLIFLQNNDTINNNLDVNKLKQNEFYQKEKCWVLFGNQSINRFGYNSNIETTRFPLEVCRQETGNLSDIYQENVFKYLRRDDFVYAEDQNLMNALINNNDYKTFFTNVIPTHLVNLMLYAEYKKLSPLFKEIMEKNNLFRGSNKIDETIFKLMKQMINYKEFVK